MVGKVNLSTSAVNQDDGTVEVTYTPLVAGAYQTYMTSLGVPISNSPSATTVQTSSPSPQNSYVLENALHLTNPQVLKPVWMQVQIRDQYDNEIVIGGHNVKATVVPTSDSVEAIPPQVDDNRNGTYTVSFLPTEEQNGEYVLSITLDDKDIRGSPTTLNIKGKSQEGKKKKNVTDLRLISSSSSSFFLLLAVDKTNTILLGVGIPIMVICLGGFLGLVFYRRWKARRDPSSRGYAPAPQEETA